MYTAHLLVGYSRLPSGLVEVRQVGLDTTVIKQGKNEK